MGIHTPSTFAAVNQPLSMSSREIADLVEKRHDNVKRTIETLADQGVIARPQIEDVPEAGSNSRTYITQVFRFQGEKGKRDSIVVVAQLSPEFTARLVDRWQDLEAKVSQPTFVLPDFANPVAAARAWADAQERADRAEIEKTEAVRTKAEIGSRREATAMATASREAKRARDLQRTLDQTSEWASARRMEKAHQRKFPWGALLKATNELGLRILKTPDPLYGAVNLYHADAWRRAYGVEIKTVAEVRQ